MTPFEYIWLVKLEPHCEYPMNCINDYDVNVMSEIVGDMSMMKLPQSHSINNHVFLNKIRILSQAECVCLDCWTDDLNNDPFDQT